MYDNRTIAHYDEHAEQLADSYHAADVSRLHARLLAAFPPHSTLLELGCGAGRETAFLLNNGFDVHGVDASAAMLSAARARHPELEERLHQAALPARLPFPDRSFDGVLALAVLMHLAPSAIGGEHSRRHLSRASQFEHLSNRHRLLHAGHAQSAYTPPSGIRRLRRIAAAPDLDNEPLQQPGRPESHPRTCSGTEAAGILSRLQRRQRGSPRSTPSTGEDLAVNSSATFTTTDICHKDIPNCIRPGKAKINLPPPCLHRCRQVQFHRSSLAA